MSTTWLIPVREIVDEEVLFVYPNTLTARRSMVTRTRVLRIVMESATYAEFLENPEWTQLSVVQVYNTTQR